MLTATNGEEVSIFKKPAQHSCGGNKIFQHILVRVATLVANPYETMSHTETTANRHGEYKPVNKIQCDLIHF